MPFAMWYNSLAFLLCSVQTVFAIVSNRGIWHAYNNSVIERYLQPTIVSDDCPTFDNATRPYSQEFIDKLKLWSGFMTDSDVKFGEVAYGSEEALLAIHNNQNPADCKTAKYLISGGWAGGFGSRVHIEGVMLGLALQMGRVYLTHPDGDNFFYETQVPFCENKDRWEPGFTCYWEPVSSKCTIKDALIGAKDVNSIPSKTFVDFNILMDDGADKDSALQWKVTKNVIAAYENIRTFNINVGRGNRKIMSFVPTTFHKLLKCSPVRHDAYLYWYRAMSATYLMRPNNMTLAMIKQLSNNVTISDYSKTIAALVRHGDKVREMTLIPFYDYAAVAEHLWKIAFVNSSTADTVHMTNALKSDSTDHAHNVHDNMHKHSNSSHHHADHLHKHEHSSHHHITNNTTDDRITSTNRRTLSTHSSVPVPHRGLATEQANGTLFISTENPDVLEMADKWGHDNHWEVKYTTLFNRAGMTANTPYRLQRVSKNVHHDLEYLSMILNLEIALKCNAWICTLASNSCRVIDELRCTIAGKCNKLYADLSRESCWGPPCIAGDSSSTGHIHFFVDQ